MQIGKYIRDSGVESLTGVLAQYTALSHLDLSHNDIEGAGVASLVGVLTRYGSLATLALHGNDIDETVELVLLIIKGFDNQAF